MKNILLILLTIFIWSCNTNDDDNEVINDDKNEITNVVSTLIAKDNLYGNGAEGITKQNLIISNQTAWNDLIAQMNLVNNVSDNFTETNINFSEHTVIAVFDELKNGIELGETLDLNVKSNSKNIIVEVIYPTSTEQISLPTMNQPFIIVKIPNSNLPIIFE